jgi:hypothetical protein
MCIGLKLCSKKNCIEQDRCLFPEEKAAQKTRTNACRIHLKWCTNERACEILGQCILEHPLVKRDKMATKELRKKCDINRVVKIISKLMPSLDRSTKNKTKRHASRNTRK